MRFRNPPLVEHRNSSGEKEALRIRARPHCAHLPVQPVIRDGVSRWTTRASRCALSWQTQTFLAGAHNIPHGSASSPGGQTLTKTGEETAANQPIGGMLSPDGTITSRHVSACKQRDSRIWKRKQGELAMHAVPGGRLVLSPWLANPRNRMPNCRGPGLSILGDASICTQRFPVSSGSRGRSISRAKLRSQPACCYELNLLPKPSGKKPARIGVLALVHGSISGCSSPPHTDGKHAKSLIRLLRRLESVGPHGHHPPDRKQMACGGQRAEGYVCSSDPQSTNPRPHAPHKCK